MARVKRGVTSHAKHKKTFKAAKGFYGRRKNTIRTAKAAVDRSMQYATRDRKAKKRFKITGSGKVVYAQQGKRHGMIKRTNKQIRNLRGTSVLFKTDGDNIKKYFLPNG